MTVRYRPGEDLGLPKGAMIGIVVDPERRSEFHKLALYSVSENMLRFKCLCNPTCEVIHEFKRLPTKGRHAK